MSLNKQRLYSDILELEENLRETLKHEPSHATAAAQYRLQLIEKTKALIQLDAGFGARKELEQLLWKPCFYKRIEEFRNRIRNFASAPSSERTTRDRFSLISVEFQQFLTEASQFYQTLCDQYVKWMQTPQVSRIATSALALDKTEESDSACEEKVEKKDLGKLMDFNRTKCRQSIHRSLIFLGDLARYRELHSQKAKKNFVLAESYYHQALQVLPGYGNPHNQLAVLATYVDSEMVAVYHYCRSLLTTHPFVTAEENLVLLFERSRQRPLAPPQLKPLTKQLTAREKAPFLKSFLHRLSRLFGVLYTNAVNTQSLGSSGPLAYSKEMEAILMKDIKPLLEMHLIGDSLLLKLVVICIFCLEKAVKTSMMPDALRISLLLSTSVLNYMLKNMDKKNKQDHVSVLRLLGPISVFCDYLKSHPFVLEEMERISSSVIDNTSNNGEYVKAFLEALAELINHPKLKSYDDNMQAKLFLLKENIELRGFLPLAKVYDPSSKLWGEQDVTSRQGSFFKSASTVAMSEAENLMIRAWNLYRFAVYLCEEFEGNPLLYSHNGSFSVSPVTVASNVSTSSINMDATAVPKLPSLVLGILDDVANKKTLSTSSSSSIIVEQPVKAVEQDEDDMDEVILFQPSFNSATKNANTLTNASVGQSAAVKQFMAEPFKTFSMETLDTSTSPFSSNDQSKSIGHLNSLKCSSDFHSFSGFESFSSSSAVPNATLGFGTWEGYKPNSLPVEKRSSESRRTFASNANVLDNTMADLAAIEHRSNLFQKEQSSLSSLFSSTREASEQITPSRPPPGFMNPQQKMSSAVTSELRATGTEFSPSTRNDQARYEDTSAAS